MSDRNSGTAPAPEGNTGLAMILGELKAEQRHHIDETAESLAELSTRQEEETAVRKSAIDEVKEIVAGLSKVIQEVVSVIESLATTNTTTRKAGKEKTAAPPARPRGESNGDFFKRLIVWAKEKGITEPPKPKGGEFANAYNKRLAEWVKESTPE